MLDELVRIAGIVAPGCRGPPYALGVLDVLEKRGMWITFAGVPERFLELVCLGGNLKEALRLCSCLPFFTMSRSPLVATATYAE